MRKALVGYTGFVGSTLLRQTDFAGLYRSTNIQELKDESFDLVVCSAAPAQKWIANREPEKDLENIRSLMGHLEKVRCKKFVLISTVDVFGNPQNVDEETPVDMQGLHAYGLHRRYLEQFVEKHFADHLIVRLPGLVGPGLRKNIIYDFLHDNNLHAIESRGLFQFYPMINLWYDIQSALAAKLKLVHLTAEPLSVAEVAGSGFGREFTQQMDGTPASYDFRTRHARAFGGEEPYQYSKRETIQAIRGYAQSERVEV